MRIGSIAAIIGFGLLATGCVNTGDDGYYYDSGFPDAPGGDDCARGCNLLNACGYAEVDDNGNFISPSDCARQCRAFGTDSTYRCLGQLGSCDQLRIQACYDEPPIVDPPATGDDGCAEGCNALRACGQCVTDGNDCLPAQTCADQCRANQQQPSYQCIADQQSCGDDIVDICFDDPPPLDDDCAAGCETLDDCSLCWPDDNGDCLTVGDCAALCRRERTPIACYADVMGCDPDAIEACNLAPPVDCATLCALFDGETRCAGCLTADRQCVSTEVCIAACEDSEPLAACLAAVDSCADPAVLDCPGVAVPERNDMGVDDMGVDDMGADDMGVEDRGVDDSGAPDLDQGAPVDMDAPDLGVPDMRAPPVDLASPDMIPPDMAAAPDCASACEGIAACQPCLPGAGPDGCLTGINCAVRCARSPDTAACTTALAACDPAAVAARCP